DFNDYWQENKRFLITVGIGLLVFMIGEMILDSVWGEDLRAQQRSVTSAQRELARSKFTAADLTRAREENEMLTVSLTELTEAVAFQPRTRFVFHPELESASNRYFSAVSAVRGELLTIASRNNLRLPEDLGLPALSPTRDEEIVRYLDALDVVDRAARLAVEAGVERVDKIEIRLDPALFSRSDVGHVEQTSIKLTMSSQSSSLVRFLSLTQDPLELGPLRVRSVEMSASRSKRDEARLDVEFVAVRMHGVDLEEAGS
ncbi:MAG: hypothetical protein QF411_06975, partial [Planctomycetota bacterium]|nr:hypothetical protein [Planctomycetota bacterium]